MKTDVTLPGLPTTPPCRCPRGLPFSSHLSPILYHISLTELWNVTANHEGYDRRRNDTNTPHLRLRTGSTTHSGTPTRLRLHLLDASMGTTCTYGGDGVVEYGGGGHRTGRLSALSTGRQAVCRRPLRAPATELRGLSWREEGGCSWRPVPADHACMTDWASSCTRS